jgi:hypothetical protein
MASLLFAEKFKSEPQNTRLPCEVLCSATAAVTLIGIADLSPICLGAQRAGRTPKEIIEALKLHHSKFLARHSIFIKFIRFGYWVAAKGLHRKKASGVSEAGFQRKSLLFRV